MCYDPFLGEIMLFAGNFPPNGWAICNGSLMSISQNTALFSILGTTYGGNGISNFALPDLRGRVPMGAGQGPGLSPRVQGDMPGAEQATVPTVQALTSVTPAPDSATTAFVPNVNPIGPTQSIPTTPPSTVLNYCIAIYGIYPSRW